MFLGEYGKTKKIIEMPSEFETNASSLLMKHRDHYSHLAYVFIMGLAFYHSSPSFRKAYHNSYKNFIGNSGEKLSTDEKAQDACHFLKYWGMTSLFHDIGYPFELTFEQVKSYFGDTIENVPFVPFNMNRFENSKTADILKKTDKLINELSQSYTNSVLNKESRRITDEEREKLEKRIKHLKKELDAEEKSDKTPAPGVSDDYLESLLAAIGELNEFKKKIVKRREDDLKKIGKLLPDYKCSDVDNLNEFLSAALAGVLGSDYEGFKDYKKFKDNA